MVLDAAYWQRAAGVYAFYANSLLDPMMADTALGLDPVFWQEFPHVEGKEPLAAAEAAGIERMRAAVRVLAALPQDEALIQLGLAHAKLFVGPGAPAAPPWETLYRTGGSVLFGQPTFDVRAAFRERSLAVDNANHQMEDHIGLELMLLAAEAERFAAALPSREALERRLAFIEEHPLSFAAAFREKVEEADPTGYYAAVAALAEGALAAEAGHLKAHLIIKAH